LCQVASLLMTLSPAPPPPRPPAPPLRVAVVGPCASGKSTLVAALFDNSPHRERVVALDGPLVARLAGSEHGYLDIEDFLAT